MYIPNHFRETDPKWIDWLAAYDSFGTLVSTVDGVPFASHLPVLYRRDGNQVALAGHWAKPNPQWHSIETQRALFVFHGPHAYVSPRWYAEPLRNVPTWNYAAAHLYGRVEVIHEPSRLEPLMTALAEQYENAAPERWRFADSSTHHALQGIVGFELRVESIELKFKLSQNRAPADAASVASALSADGAPESRTVAQLMSEIGKRQP